VLDGTPTKEDLHTDERTRYDRDKLERNKDEECREPKELRVMSDESCESRTWTPKEQIGNKQERERLDAGLRKRAEMRDEKKREARNAEEPPVEQQRKPK